MAETALSAQLADGQQNSEAAMVMHFFCGLLIRPALELAVASFKNISDTGQIARVGDDWLQAAEKLGAALECGWAIDGDLSEDDWATLDRIEFRVMLGRYSASTTLTAALCVYVGVTLIISAVIIYFMSLMLLIAGLILSALVALIIVCMVLSNAPVVGPAFKTAEQALRRAANWCAKTFAKNVELVSKQLDKILKLAAEYMMRMCATEAIGQVFTVNPEAITDLIGGATDSIGDIVKGSLELLVRNLQAWMLGKKIPPPQYLPSGDSPQPQET